MPPQRAKHNALGAVLERISVLEDSNRVRDTILQDLSESRDSAAF
jgi:hypothetical protein